MEESKTKPTNKGLAILLGVLVTAIVGLGIGIGTLMMLGNSREKGMDEIIAEYQGKIDAEENAERKVELYKERYYMVISAMDETGKKYCTQAADDLGELFTLVDDDTEMSDIVNAMPSKCIQTSETHTIETVTNEGGAE